VRGPSQATVSILEITYPQDCLALPTHPSLALQQLKSLDHIVNVPIK